MNMKIVGSLIGVAIAIIMIGSVLAPIVTDVTAESDTFVNDGYYTMDIVTDSYTMEWSASDKTNLIINDTSYDLVNFVRGKEVTIIATPEMILRLAHTVVTGEFYFTSYGGGIGYWGVNSLNSVHEFSLNVTAGVISVDYTTADGTSNKTYPVASEIYALNPTDSGNYTMKSSTSSAYVLESSSIIILAGNTRVGATDVSILAKGDVDNLNFVVINGDGVNPTFTDVVATYTESNNHVDLIELEKVNFTISIDGGTSVNAEYSYFLVPTEVTAERTEPLDRGAATVLVATIPMFIIVGLMMALFMIRRD